MTSWLRDRLWIRGRIVRALTVAADRILFVDHHLSPAASAFFCSPFDSAALLTVDGVGEWTSASIGRAHFKRREEFRPFAPVVVEERARDYFDLPAGRRSEPARFMQVVHAVREGAATSLAAVDHFGTSRPQTLSEEENPLCDALLRRFGEATRHPVLLNTSFNLKGEPIVASPDDALSTHRHSGLDVLMMDHFMVDGRG